MDDVGLLGSLHSQYEGDEHGRARAARSKRSMSDVVVGIAEFQVE